MKLAPHDGHPAPPASSGVLDDDDPRAALEDDPSHLAPEAGAISVDSGTAARDGEILAGEAAEDREALAEVASVSNVGNASCARLVSREDTASERVDLDLDADPIDEADVSGSAPEDAAPGEELDPVTGHPGTRRTCGRRGRGRPSSC